KVPRRAEPPERQRPTEPEGLAARSVELIDANVSQSSLRREYLVPSYITAKDNEHLALDILADILGNGPTSRLYRKLVVEEKAATSASTWYNGLTMDATTLGFYAVPSDNTNLDDLAKRIDDVIAEVVKSGVTADEVDRAKKRMIASTIYS